ncbi:hypothetical protein V8B97DRAFT_1924296 [Scleroderma yunnanense]
MSFVRSSSPPPPLPSPQLIPASLPSPPPLSKRSSKTHLSQHSSPPSPFSPIGDSLIPKTITSFRSHERLDRRAKAGLFGDDDDFGTCRSSPYRRLVAIHPSSPRTLKRIQGNPSLRCRSPPPSPAVASPPPPVPPIPSFMLAPTDKKSVLQPVSKRSTAHQAIFDRYIDHHHTPEHTPDCSRKRCESTPNAMTCMQFFAIHNSSRRDCKD